MVNPSKNKGTAAETLVVRWFRGHGFPYADRQPLRGNRDADREVTAGHAAWTRGIRNPLTAAMTAEHAARCAA